ncbi:MAG: SDR family NAD(P)-dependent oxidoreductase [Chlorobi bacterium]|nr:SDR family NAD(P)-dependent oxidoreductase [Chlorobiota bacterium]
MSHGRFDNPVVAALAGIKDFFSKQELAERLTGTDRFDGKTCIITGANSGLGFGIAVEMARRGAHVIMAGRSRIPEAGEEVKKLSGSDHVEMRYVDLSRINTIYDFVEGLKRDKIKPDVTILNAGVALPGARKTESGIEEMFLVNYLSNVILTQLMINRGVIPAKYNGSSFRPRIVFISSDSHQGSSAIDYDEFGVYEQYGVSKGISNYSYFKLVLNTYAVELSRRINKDKVNVGVNVICPGPVHTEIIKNAPRLLYLTLKSIFRIIFRSPAKAALPVVYMSVSPDYEGKTEEYLHMFRHKKMDPKCYDREEGKKLWDESFKLWKSVDPKAKMIG